MSLSLTLAVAFLPIPLMHLWLHALLPWWRRNVFVFYIFSACLWILTFRIMLRVAAYDVVLWQGGSAARLLGLVFVMAGGVAILWSVTALGPRRFFAYAALTDAPGTASRVSAGPFRFVPHPAYLGYCTILLGLLMRNGTVLSVMIFFYLIALTPLVILHEERELQGRLNG